MVMVLEPGYLLHRRRYRESSLLLEIFTPQYGRMGLVARGAAGGRRSQTGVLQAFQPLLFSWRGRGELKTLASVEGDGPACFRDGKALFGGFYLNELLLRLVLRDDPHPELYQAYDDALQGLGNTETIEVTLRIFEKRLLEAIGYGLVLDREVDSEKDIIPTAVYHFHPQQGPSPSTGSAGEGMTVSGATLLALSRECFDENKDLQEAKQLMRGVLQFHLGDKPLASRKAYMRPARSLS